LENGMTAEAIAKRQHSRSKKVSGSAAKSAIAARLAHIGTDGLGSHDDDFTFFLGLDQIEQSHLIRDGMEAVIVSRIANELLDIPVQTLLASLRLPSSTINRKISQGERLSASESDRAARTMLAYAQAKDVLEDEKLAAEWLLRPNVQLRDERPLDMLDTQTGYDRVRDILLRLEYGVTV
jgi:putative toxin-antitoxin system antitoxin component (TIGR02293 family)